MQNTKVIARTPYAIAIVALLSPWTATRALDTVFDIAAGPRLDEFQWSIAGNGAGRNPNILSELTWRSVDSVQLSLGVEAISDSGVTWQGRFAYGAITDGRVQDSDYLGDNRSSEFSRAEARNEDDDLFDITLSVGKQIPVTNTSSMSVTPLIGLSYHQQNFRATDGVQVIDRFGGTAGQPLSGLDTTYETEWWSTFLGLQFDHRGSAWDWFGRVEYHNVDYEAEADWNLRSDLAHPVSFKHKADGSGPVYKVGTRYRFAPNWAFTADLTWANWDSDNGTDRTYLSDGRQVSTHLNTARWEVNALMLGLAYRGGEQ